MARVMQQEELVGKIKKYYLQGTAASDIARFVKSDQSYVEKVINTLKQNDIECKQMEFVKYLKQQEEMAESITMYEEPAEEQPVKSKRSNTKIGTLDARKDYEHIYKVYCGARSTAEAAKKLGTSYSTVIRSIEYHRLGGPTNLTIKDIVDEQLIEEYNSYGEEYCAAKYNSSASTIHNRLIKLIGKEAVAKHNIEFRGRSGKIPDDKKLAIAEEFENGKSVKELAGKHQLPISIIKQIVREVIDNIWFDKNDGLITQDTITSIVKMYINGNSVYKIIKEYKNISTYAIREILKASLGNEKYAELAKQNQGKSGRVNGHYYTKNAAAKKKQATKINKTEEAVEEEQPIEITTDDNIKDLDESFQAPTKQSDNMYLISDMMNFQLKTDLVEIHSSRVHIFSNFIKSRDTAFLVSTVNKFAENNIRWRDGRPATDIVLNMPSTCSAQYLAVAISVFNKLGVNVRTNDGMLICGKNVNLSISALLNSILSGVKQKKQIYAIDPIEDLNKYNELYELEIENKENNRTYSVLFTEYDKAMNMFMDNAKSKGKKFILSKHSAGKAVEVLLNASV